MDKQTEFVLRTIEERDIRFVRLWFTDVLGMLKSVAIAPAELEGAFAEARLEADVARMLQHPREGGREEPDAASGVQDAAYRNLRLAQDGGDQFGARAHLLARRHPGFAIEIEALEKGGVELRRGFHGTAVSIVSAITEITARRLSCRPQ